MKFWTIRLDVIEIKNKGIIHKYLQHPKKYHRSQSVLIDGVEDQVHFRVLNRLQRKLEALYRCMYVCCPAQSKQTSLISIPIFGLITPRESSSRDSVNRLICIINLHRVISGTLGNILRLIRKQFVVVVPLRIQIREISKITQGCSRSIN